MPAQHSFFRVSSTAVRIQCTSNYGRNHASPIPPYWTAIAHHQECRQRLRGHCLVLPCYGYAQTLSTYSPTLGLCRQCCYRCSCSRFHYHCCHRHQLYRLLPVKNRLAFSHCDRRWRQNALQHSPIAQEMTGYSMKLGLQMGTATCCWGLEAPWEIHRWITVGERSSTVSTKFNFR